MPDPDDHRSDTVIAMLRLAGALLVLAAASPTIASADHKCGGQCCHTNNCTCYVDENGECKLAAAGPGNICKTNLDNSITCVPEGGAPVCTPSNVKGTCGVAANRETYRTEKYDDEAFGAGPFPGAVYRWSGDEDSWGYDDCKAGTYADRERFLEELEAAGVDCTGCASGEECEPCKEECYECPPGKFSGARADSCDDCPAGEVAPAAAASECTPCTELEGAGTFPNEARTSCQACPLGQYLPGGGGGAEPCALCPVGTFSDERPQTEPCTACSDGTFSASPGQTTCEACGPSAFMTVTGDGRGCRIRRYLWIGLGVVAIGVMTAVFLRRRGHR